MNGKDAIDCNRHRETKGTRMTAGRTMTLFSSSYFRPYLLLIMMLLAVKESGR